MMAKVSLIVPVYNVERYLGACLDTLLGQTLKDIEIVCVNDGTKDGSREILAQYAARDARIVVVDQENAGLSAARNHGLDVASGEYALFMDSDDLLEPAALERLSARASRDQLDILFYNCDCFADDPSAAKQTASYQNYYHRSHEYAEVKSGAKTISDMMANSEYLCSACLELWRTAFLKDNKLKFVKGILHEDAEFTFRAALLAKRVSHLGETFFHRRVRGSGSIMTSGARFLDVYGAFRAFLGMEAAYRDFQSNGGMDVRLMQEMAAVLDVSRQRYAKLGLKERAKLSSVADPQIRHLFKSLVADAVDGGKSPSLAVKSCAIRPTDGSVKISVIIPVYNMGQYVGECLDSILAQTLHEIEVICVDDGSTDASPLILADYAGRDSRVKVLSQKNLGVFAARNNALDVANGEFVIFMDPDDWYASPKALEWLYTEAVANKVDICGGELVEMLDKNTPRPLPVGYKPSYLYRRSGFFAFSDYQYFGWYTRFAFKRSLLEENGIRFPAYTRYQDPPFLVRAMIAAGQFYAFKRTIYACRVQHKTITWQTNGCKKLVDFMAGNADIFRIARMEGLHRLFDRQKENLISTGMLRHVLDNLSVPEVHSGLANLLDAMGGKASCDLMEWVSAQGREFEAETKTMDDVRTVPQNPDVNLSSGFLKNILRRTVECYHAEGSAYTLKRLLALGRK